MKNTGAKLISVAGALSLLLTVTGTHAQEDCLGTGTEFFGQKKHKQAVMTLKKCEDKPDAQRLLGLAYYELNYMTDAQKYLEKAMASFPAEVLLKQRYAMSFALNRQFKRGVEEFRALAKAYPKDIEIKKGLAQVLGWNRTYGEAITLYKEVLAKDPKDFETWVQIGVLTSWDKRFTDAVKVFDEIVAAQPPRQHEITARVNKAQVLSWMKKFGDAVEEYDKAIALDPKAIDAYLGKGQVLEWQGIYKGAITVYEQALQAEPGNNDAKARLQQLMWVK